MGRLHTLAAGTALLAFGVKAQFSYQGCAALDTSTIKKTTELYPQGPAPCLAYCNGIGYSYAGLVAQFCSCWEFSPVVSKNYANSENVDCSFNCDDPYNTQYCGGIDLSTLGFLYSYYAGVAPAVIPGPSSSSTAPGEIATSSGVVSISPSATSSSGESTATPATSTDAGGVIPPSSSSSADGLSPSSSSSAGGLSPSSSSSADGLSPSSTDAGGVIPPSSSSSAGGLSPSSSSSAGGLLPSSSSSGDGLSPTLSSTSAGEVLPTTSSGVLPPASSGPSGGVSPSSSGAAGSDGVPPPSSFPSGVIVPTSTGSGPAGSASASPSATGVGGAPIQTIVVLSPGQAFVITIAPFLRNLGDQALSYIPSPPWLLYNTNTTSFYGTVPLDFPAGPLIITVTAGQRTTGSNGLGRRQIPSATYTFAIELLIVGPGISIPTVPSGPVATPTLASIPGGPPGGPGPVVPGATFTPGAVLPSYTNTVYQTITSTITRCPVCPPEVTQFAVPIGTTCITAEVFTTPCEITVTTTRPDGVVTPTVVTTTSRIPYNPADSTVVVKTVDLVTSKYTTTLLVAVTRTVQKLQPTGEAGAVQPPPPPPPAPGPPGVPAAGPVPGAPAPAAPVPGVPAAAPVPGVPAAAPVPGAPAPAAPVPGVPAAAPVPGAPAPAAPVPGVPAAAPVPGAPAPAGPNGAPFAGPVAPPPPPPNGAYGTGAANNGSQGAAPTMPVTAGASMDRFVEMFVLLCGVAFGALLVL